MAELRVALLQLASHGSDQQANLEKGEHYCRLAAHMGADIALFPEMWNIGYSTYSPDVWHDSFDPYDPQYATLRAAWQAQAIAADSQFVRHFRALAAALKMAIAITYLETWPGAPRDSVSLIDRHGDIVLTYAKVHTCEWGFEAACTPGDAFPVCTLDIAQGSVRVGCMICYDREHPESARSLMLGGAEIILTPNACTLEINRLAQFRARAFENMTGLAMSNYAAPQENGHSIALTAWPMASTTHAICCSSRRAKARVCTWLILTWTGCARIASRKYGAMPIDGHAPITRWCSSRQSRPLCGASPAVESPFYEKGPLRAAFTPAHSGVLFIRL